MPDEYDRFNSSQKRIFWEQHLGQWQHSGLSRRAYCHMHDLKPYQFYYWSKRLVERQDDVSFLPLALPADPVRHPHTIRILTPNGFSIELEDRRDRLQQLVAMVAAL